MIERYSRPETKKVWSDGYKYLTWARVEIAVLQAKVNLRMLDVKIPDDLIEKIIIDVEAIEELEETNRHDMISFLMHTSEQLPEYLRPFWHDGMTSYDTEDTAMALLMMESIDILIAELTGLMDVIKERAFEYKYASQIGRTHGVHAEPITFGVKLAKYHADLQRDLQRLRQLRKSVAKGNISGAVGMYTLPPEVEKEACRILGLEPVPATQIISRDIHAEYLCTLAIAAGTLEKISTTIRTLQRTEIYEAQEFFDKEKQRGSSAMPHKRNPIMSENVSGLTRIIRSNAFVALEMISTWDERDISNSGSERIIYPDSSILLQFLYYRLTGIINKMFVYPENMEKNIWITKGLVFSQNVQSLVANKSNLPREDAYELVRQVAQECLEKNKDFLPALLESQDIMRFVTEDELRTCFDLKKKLKHVDDIFDMIFGKEGG